MAAPLSDDAIAMMERLWSNTRMTGSEIATAVNAAYGVTLVATQVERRASKFGWTRALSGQSMNHRGQIEARLFLRSLNRATGPEDNPVRRVAPGTYRVVGGFGMGRGA